MISYSFCWLELSRQNFVALAAMVLWPDVYRLHEGELRHRSTSPLGELSSVAQHTSSAKRSRSEVLAAQRLDAVMMQLLDTARKNIFEVMEVNGITLDDVLEDTRDIADEVCTLELEADVCI
jgi:hypothetical protein